MFKDKNITEFESSMFVEQLNGTQTNIVNFRINLVSGGCSIIIINSKFLSEFNDDIFKQINYETLGIGNLLVEFDNCCFNENFIFQTPKDLIAKFSFKNCRFEKALKLSNWSGKILKDIFIENVQVLKDLDLQFITDNSRFINIIVEGDFNINGLKASLYPTEYHFDPIKNYSGRERGPYITRFVHIYVKGNFNISNSKLGVLLFIDITTESLCKIESCRIIGNFDIDDCKFKNFEITNSPGKYRAYQFPTMLITTLLTNNLTVYETFTLRSIIESSAFFSQSKFRFILFDKIGVQSDLIFDRCEIEGGHLQSVTIFKTLSLKNCSQLNFSTMGPVRADNLNISNNRKGIIQIANTSVNSIFLDGILSKDFSVELTEIQTNLLRFNKFNNLGSFNINSLYLVNFKIKNKSQLDNDPNYPQIYIIKEANEDNIIPKLEIISSDLGKMAFTNCNIPDITQFTFNNSRIIDINVFATTFPKELIVESVNENSNQRREIYSQFKKVYDSKGDSIEALNYQALELESYRQSLKLEKGIKAKAEKAVLTFNRYTNNYGTNWLLSAVILGGVSIILFCFYCWAYGFKVGRPMDWFLTRNLLSFFFEFIFPIRRPDFLDEFINKYYRDHHVPHKSLARAIDYMSRFATSILGYQLVQAFRKHGKR